jgi:hypothetical protein
VFNFADGFLKVKIADGLLKVKKVWLKWNKKNFEVIEE